MLIQRNDTKLCTIKTNITMINWRLRGENLYDRIITPMPLNLSIEVETFDVDLLLSLLF